MRSLLLCLVCACLSGVRAAVYVQDQVEIPGHEGKCYDNNGKTFYSKGDVMKNERVECAEKRCLGFAPEIGKLRIKTITCPVVEAGAGCTVVQDLSKPYPECCPRLVARPSAQPNSCRSQKRDRK